MSKHTPEPWRAERDPCHFHTLSSIYGHAHARSVAEVGGMTMDEQAANTMRIVACVNALAGIDDPALFMQRIREIELATRPDGDMADYAVNVILSTLLPKEPTNG